MVKFHDMTKCQVFKNFLKKKIKEGIFSLEKGDINLLKLNEGEQVQVKEAAKVPIPTYKNSLETMPMMSPKAVGCMKSLRNILCDRCFDVLHFEIVKIKAVPYDPQWLMAY